MATFPHQNHHHHSPAHALLPDDLQTLSDLAAMYGVDTLVDALRLMTTQPPGDVQRNHFEHVDLIPMPLEPWSPALDGFIPTGSPWEATDMNAPSDTGSGTPYPQSNFSSSPEVSAVDFDMDADSDLFQPFSPSSWPGVHFSTLPPANRLSQPTPRSVPQSSASSPSTSILTDTGPRKPIDCPPCSAHGIFVGFGRKSDFKKHLYKFHAAGSLWVCPAPGCGAAFDVERAYAAHAKAAHVGELLSPGLEGGFSSEAARAQIGPRRVLACGFTGCKAVFERNGDGDGAVALEEFFDHLAAHFGNRSRPASGLAPRGGSEGGWTHSTQVGNLLRQTALKAAWKGLAGAKEVRGEMRWEPGRTGHLKAMLETREFGDVQGLLRSALALGKAGAEGGIDHEL